MEDNLSEVQIEEERIVPWEQRSEIGFLKGFLFTCKEVIFLPHRFFSKKFKEEWEGPYLFGIINLLVVILSYILFFFLLPSIPYEKENLLILKKFIISPWFLLSSPFICLLGVLIATIIFHLGIWVMGARKGLLATFRAICYTTGTFLLLLIPIFSGVLMFLSLKIRLPVLSVIIIFIGAILIFLGNLLAQIWPLVVLNIGFKHLQKISFARTISGTFISLTLGFILVIVAAFTLLPIISPFIGGKGVCQLSKNETVAKPISFAWDIQTVDSKGDVGAYSAIEVGGNNRVHIIYDDHNYKKLTDKEIKYAYWDGVKWQIETVDKGVWGEGEIAVDKNNKPHVTYCYKYEYKGGYQTKSSGIAFGNDVLKYAHKEDNGWKREIIDTGGDDDREDVGWSSDIVLDSKGYPHVIYIGNSNREHVIKYIFWNGSEWKRSIVDKRFVYGRQEKNYWTENPGLEISLALDALGKPHIAYFDQNSLELKYAMWNNSEWKIQPVEKFQIPEDRRVGADVTPSLALDKSGNPRILYETSDYSSPIRTELKLASWTGSEWKIQTIDTEVFRGMGGRAFSLRLDREDLPHIAYIGVRGISYWDLKYAHWTGTEWSIELVEAQKSGWSAHYTGSISMSLDKNDKPHISYFDVNKLDLKYAYKR